jgi:hypothetical protein
MTIGPATADDVQKAMQRFDLETRDTPEWRQWEKDKSNKFAFVWNGRLYPMKEVISKATGTPKTDFSGGEESIRFANKLGLIVEALRLPSETETAIALHEFLLSAHPEPIEPKAAYDRLARIFTFRPSERSSCRPMAATSGRIGCNGHAILLCSKVSLITANVAFGV